MQINFAQNDNQFQEIIDLIHQFAWSTLFFRWLGKDDLIVHMLVDKVQNGIYERVGEYSLDNIKIFSGGAQFKMSRTPKTFQDRLLSDEKLFYSYQPELALFEKKELSHTLDGSNYTVISQFYCYGCLCGSCWEIYDLPNLLKVYKVRKVRLAL